MAFLLNFIDMFLHLDRYLNEWAGVFGVWLYVLLFVIIFCETGLVVTPVLPGDSMLFAVGALAATEGSPLNIVYLCVVLGVAAVLGDAVNYSIGKWVGPKVFSRESSRWLDKRHLLKAHEFYEKYGGKTIILARFLPFFRTFAPFVAGIGSMTYLKFASYNVIGGLLWTSSFLLLGYKFAGTEMVKKNFHYVILAIVLISAVPAAVEVWKARREHRRRKISS
ncbi:MAG: DedA family protein [Elusimicrobiaceae bacterium]|nr:DedA family protein [Elusimicrobiaceae bacterium]